MSQPTVTIVELDGNLGSQPSGQKILALVGAATSGALNVPSTFSRAQDVISTFAGSGKSPLVKAALYHIKTRQMQVLLVRTAASIAGTYDTIDRSGVTGTASTHAANGATTPTDDAQIVVKFIVGGAVGTTGITYQASLDGGNLFGPVTALGTATEITFADLGGAGIVVGNAADTIIAGDVIKTVTHAAKWNATDLTAALEALRVSAVAWDIVGIVGDTSASEFDAIETEFGSMADRMYVAHVAPPTAAQTEATYLSALTTAFGSKSTTHGMLVAGDAACTDADTGAQPTRSPIHAVVSLLASQSEEVDISLRTLGALPGVAIRDANGNVAHHDESVNPGLDDARFCVLRSWNDKQGVYVNNPNLFSPTGSDFKYAQHRRLANLSRAVLVPYFADRLSKPVVVNATTGFIDSNEADEIERGADAAMHAALLSKPKVSGGGVQGKRTRFVQINRFDNLLSNPTINVQAGFIPLAYPKKFDVSLGMRNPALQIVSL